MLLEQWIFYPRQDRQVFWLVWATLCIIALDLLLPARSTAEKYWIYDGEKPFTQNELYMMQNCGMGCSSNKQFNTIKNPPDIPILSDRFAVNNKSAMMFFPGCQFATSDNFCKKSMSQPSNQRQFPYGSDVWQAFSVFVPANYKHNTGWNVLYQFHGHPDNIGTCDNWRSPPFSIAIRKSKTWEFNARYSTLECNTKGNKTGVNKIVLEEKQLVVKGDWTHFVMHLRFDYSGNGAARVWIKDADNLTPVQIVNYIGPLGFNDKNPPYDYVSFGYYYGRRPGPDVTLYFDRIIFGDSSENLKSMMYNPPH